jgi:hypothetical protein
MTIVHIHWVFGRLAFRSRVPSRFATPSGITFKPLDLLFPVRIQRQEFFFASDSLTETFERVVDVRPVGTFPKIHKGITKQFVAVGFCRPTLDFTWLWRRRRNGLAIVSYMCGGGEQRTTASESDAPRLWEHGAVLLAIRCNWMTRSPNRSGPANWDRAIAPFIRSI